MDLIKEDYEISLWKDQEIEFSPTTEISNTNLFQYYFWLNLSNTLLEQPGYEISSDNQNFKIALECIKNGQINLEVTKLHPTSDIYGTIILPKISTNLINQLQDQNNFKFQRYYYNGPTLVSYHSCKLWLLPNFLDYKSQLYTESNLINTKVTSETLYNYNPRGNTLAPISFSDNSNCGIIIYFWIQGNTEIPSSPDPATTTLYNLINFTFSDYNTSLVQGGRPFKLYIPILYKNINDYFENNILNNYLTEKLVTKLGSAESTSLNRPIQPKFTDNLNGSHTLTFILYDKYIDPVTSEKMHNPYVDLIKNESKIKLRLNDKWYDFVVKQIDSSSDKKSYIYTCKDQYINELSKQGYNVEFDTELMNNIDTADRLAAATIKDSGWEVISTPPEGEEPEEEKIYSDMLIESKDEPLICFKTRRKYPYVVEEFLFKAIYHILYNDLAEIEKITKASTSWYYTGQLIELYIPYSAYQSEAKEFQLVCRILQEDKTDFEEIIYNKDTYNVIPRNDNSSITQSWYVTNFNWDTEAFMSYIDIMTTPYYLNTISKNNLYQYDPLTKKVVQLYEEDKVNKVNEQKVKEKVKDFYAFTENEFVSPTLVSNYVANSENFSSTSGWSIDKGGSIKLGVLGKTWFVTNQQGEKVESPVLVCRFPNNALLKNTGISSNFSKIKSFHKGEKYVLRVRACRQQLTQQNKKLRSNPSRSDDSNKKHDCHTDAGHAREMMHRGYWDNSEDAGMLTTTYPLTFGRGIGGELCEYKLENGQYTIVKTYAEFKWAHDCEYYCLEDFPVGPYEDGDWSGEGKNDPNKVYIKDPHTQLFRKEGAEDKVYIRFGFFTDLHQFGNPFKLPEGKSWNFDDNSNDDSQVKPSKKYAVLYGRANPLFREPEKDNTKTVTHDRTYNKQIHYIENEVDPFYLPTHNEFSNYRTLNIHYKYMIAEIKESITEKDLREKPIALFLKSFGPYYYEGNTLPKDNTTSEGYGTPEWDSPDGKPPEGYRVVQDINIQNVELFPFKTRKAQFTAYNDLAGTQGATEEYNWSPQWSNPKNNGPFTELGDELILPETAPDSSTVNRILWKCYDPNTIQTLGDEFSLEFTEGQISQEIKANKTYFNYNNENYLVQTDEYGDYIEIDSHTYRPIIQDETLIIEIGEQQYLWELILSPLYPDLYNLSIFEFGTKLAANDATISSNAESLFKKLITNQVFNNTSHISFDTNNIIFNTSNDEYLTEYEYELYKRIKADNDNHYEPYYEVNQETDIRTFIGYKLKENQNNPSYSIDLDHLKALIGFNSTKYTSLSSEITLDQVDYFYTGADAPEVAKPDGDDLPINSIIWKPKTNDTFEKYRMIQAKNSNYFDILQKICESFECWMDFNIAHESDGRIAYTDVYDEYGFIVGKKPQKTIVIKEKRGNQNSAQFRSAINLKDSAKKSDSNNFATHLIVANNANEFGEDGFCSISRAENNPLKENYLFNFDYYTQTDRIDRDTLMNDLYGEGGYYTQIAKINEGKPEKIKQMSSLLVDLTKLEANVDFYQTAYDSAQAAALEALADFNDYKSKDDSEVDCKTVSEAIEKYNTKFKNDKQARSYGVKLKTNNANAADYLARYTYWQKQYNNEIAQLLELQDWQKKATAKISELTRIFYNKYQSYIADATWSSNDYTNDDLYYFEAQRKLAVAAKPKVTYTFSVISLDKLPGYEGYKFKVGDRVQVIDTDFFGYESDGITPKKVEVIVTELIRDLDNPDKTTVKVQTYQDNFTSLFQRITSSVNQLK